MKEKIIQAVAGQIIAMYENNVMNSYGNECFENWCENGNVFRDPLQGLTEREATEAVALMKKLALHVDNLTNAIENESD